MTPLAWVALFLGTGAFSELISPLLAPNLVQRFPLKFMCAKLGEPRTISFVRIICSTAIFGAMVGLLAGFLVFATKGLLRITFGAG